MNHTELSYAIESNILGGKSRDTIVAALRRGIGQPPVPVSEPDIAAAYDICLARLRTGADTDDDAIAVEVRILQGLYEKAYKGGDIKTSSSLMNKISSLKGTGKKVTVLTRTNGQTFKNSKQAWFYLDAAGWDISYKSVRNHIKDRLLMPDQHGIFHQADVDRYADRELTRKNGTDSDPIEKIYARRAKAAADSEEHKAKLLALELKEKQGRTVDREEMARTLEGLLVAFMSRSLMIGKKHAPTLAKITDPVEIEAILEAEARHMCEDLANFTEKVGGNEAKKAEKTEEKAKKSAEKAQTLPEKTTITPVAERRSSPERSPDGSRSAQTAEVSLFFTPSTQSTPSILQEAAL